MRIYGERGQVYGAGVYGGTGVVWCCGEDEETEITFDEEVESPAVDCED